MIGRSEAARRIEAAGLRKQAELAAAKSPEMALIPRQENRVMIEPKERTLPNRGRTSSGLRDVLFDAIEEVRLGKLSADQARAVCDLTKQILGSVRLEIEAKKSRGEGETDVPPLQLGDAG